MRGNGAGSNRRGCGGRGRHGRAKHQVNGKRGSNQERQSNDCPKGGFWGFLAQLPRAIRPNAESSRQSPVHRLQHDDTAISPTNRLTPIENVVDRLPVHRPVVYVPEIHVDQDKCTGCGTCAEVCPNGSITILDDKPSFDENCMGCGICVDQCSEEALVLEVVKNNREINDA